MRCGFCGQEAPELTNYCDRCGQPLQQASRSKLFGVLLIIFGVLPALIPTQLFSLPASQSSIEQLSAYSIITMCPEFFSGFLFDPSMIIAVIAGCMVLKKDTTPRSALLTCGIIQIISFVFYWIINMTLLVAPEVMLYALAGSTSATALLRNAPELLLWDQLYWGLRMLLTAGITVISFVAMAKTKPFAVLQTQRLPFIGILLTFITQPLYTMIHNLFLKNYGALVFSGYSIGNVIYSNFSGLVAPCMGIALLIVAVMLTRRKAGVLHGVVMGGLALFTFTAIILAEPLFLYSSAPVDIFARGLDFYTGIAIGSMLSMAAQFFWFSSISRNRVPIWRQILCPLLTPVIFLFAEIIALGTLVLDPTFPWATTAVAVTTALFAIPSSTYKAGNRL